MSERAKKILYILLSLLFAIAFWFYVDDAQGNTITKTFKNVPIEFIGEDWLHSQNWMLAPNEKVSVDLELRGPRSVITGLERSDLAILVDLTKIAGKGPFPLAYQLLTPDNVPSSSITIEKASVSTITVNVVDLATEEIDVQVLVVGDPADNYKYIAERLEYQQTITISGTVEDVESIDKAFIKIDVTGQKASINREFSYDLYDVDGNIVNVEETSIQADKRIRVKVPIYEMKTVPLRVVFAEAPGSREENIEYTLNMDSVEILGESSELRRMNELVIGPVDLSRITELEDKLELEIPVPETCHSEVSTVTLTVRFKNVEIRRLSVSNIEVRGAEGKTYKLDQEWIDVFMRGAPNDLALLTPEDVRIVLDLSEYHEKGDVKVPVTVIVKINGDGDKVIAVDQIGAVGSYYVDVKITGVS